MLTVLVHLDVDLLKNAPRRIRESRESAQTDHTSGRSALQPLSISQYRVLSNIPATLPGGNRAGASQPRPGVRQDPAPRPPRADASGGLSGALTHALGARR